jgi:hypothetical protein
MVHLFGSLALAARKALELRLEAYKRLGMAVNHAGHVCLAALEFFDRRFNWNFGRNCIIVTGGVRGLNGVIEAYSSFTYSYICQVIILKRLAKSDERRKPRDAVLTCIIMRCT